MSYFALLVFTILVFWRPQEWLFPALYGIPFLDIITYVAVLGMMLEYDTGNISLRFKRPIFILYLGLFVAALMSHIAHFYYQGLVDNWIVAFRICFFGILLFATMNSPKRMMWMIRVIVFMACFMTIHAILQQTRGYGFGNQPPIYSWRPNVDYLVPRSKFFGIFEDPNDMGQMLATAMPLSFLLFRKKSFLTFCIGCAITWFLWMGIETTWSRGSQVAVVVAGTVMLIQIFPARCFLGLLGACMVGGLGILPFSNRFMEGSAFERLDFWGQANWAFKANPIFGVGLGMVAEYINRGRAVHNAFVTAYAELGVFGYFFWFSLILVSVVGLAQTKQHLKDDESIDGQYLHRVSCWGIAGFMGFLASAYFLSRPYVFPLIFLISLFGAVPYVAKAKSDCAEELYIPSWRDCCIMGIPLSLGSIVYIYISILLLNAAR